MSSPWDMTPAQRRQFREAQAQRKEREMARPELPYLDESGDLHVTAAMEHEIREASLDAGAGRDPGYVDISEGYDPFAFSPARILDRRLSAILGERLWRDEIKPRLQAAPRMPDGWRLEPTVFGMRLFVEPE